MYLNGSGVPQDFATALSWFQKAADQGAANAQSNLGFMYEHGQGVSQDYAAAASWYRKAADQGDPGGQYNLGAIYSIRIQTGIGRELQTHFALRYDVPHGMLTLLMQLGDNGSYAAG
jgi:TPR repeat protein